MIQRNPGLPDQYFLDSFVGGLKPSLKPFVRAFKPQALAAAVEYARLQEETLEATKTTFKSTPIPKINSPTYSSGLSKNFAKSTLPPLLPTPTHSFQSTPSSSSTSSVSNQPQKKLSTILTPAERREKQRKGLCYFCDQPYSRNHSCQLKQTQLFTVEIPGVVQIGMRN